MGSPLVDTSIQPAKVTGPPLSKLIREQRQSKDGIELNTLLLQNIPLPKGRFLLKPWEVTEV